METTKIDNKALIDIWIDSVEGAGASSKYTQRLKKMRLIQIFNDPQNIDKIINSTLELASNRNESIKSVRKAYKGKANLKKYI